MRIPVSFANVVRLSRHALSLFCPPPLPLAILLLPFLSALLARPAALLFLQFVVFSCGKTLTCRQTKVESAFHLVASAAVVVVSPVVSPVVAIVVVIATVAAELVL